MEQSVSEAKERKKGATTELAIEKPHNPVQELLLRRRPAPSGPATQRHLGQGVHIEAAAASTGSRKRSGDGARDVTTGPSGVASPHRLVTLLARSGAQWQSFTKQRLVTLLARSGAQWQSVQRLVTLLARPGAQWQSFTKQSFKKPHC